VTATYEGDSAHGASIGATTITVVERTTGGTIGGETNDNGGSEKTELLPATQLKRHPSKRTMIREAKFVFGSDTAGAHFECKLDSRPFKACFSPFDKRVNPGAHEFYVRAVNVSGSADPTPVVFRWRVIAP